MTNTPDKKTVPPPPAQKTAAAPPAAVAPVQSAPAPAVPAGNAEAAADTKKVIAKKVTGFLGDLAEKAKKIDYNAMAGKTLQKVNEVKGKAAELSAGKTDSEIPARDKISADVMKAAFSAATGKMNENTGPELEAILPDILPGEVPLVKTKLDADQALVLTAKSLISLGKVSEQVQVQIFPLDKIEDFSVVLPKGAVAGRFQINCIGGKNVRMTLPSIETYVKALLVLRKVREITKR